MKRVVLLIIAVLICGVVVFSCNKDRSEFAGGVELEEGAYSGTFTVKYFVDMPGGWAGSGSGKTTLVLNNGKFTNAGNPDRIPAGGSGNYTVGNAKIVFEEIHAWTADFDFGLVLNGEYDYKFDGKKLIFSKVYDGYARYEYNLEKE